VVAMKKGQVRNFWRIPESRKEGRKEGKIRAGGDGAKGGDGQEGEKGRVGGGRGGRGVLFDAGLSF